MGVQDDEWLKVRHSSTRSNRVATLMDELMKRHPGDLESTWFVDLVIALNALDVIANISRSQWAKVRSTSRAR